MLALRSLLFRSRQAWYPMRIVCRHFSRSGDVPVPTDAFITRERNWSLASKPVIINGRHDRKAVDVGTGVDMERLLGVVTEVATHEGYVPMEVDPAHDGGATQDFNG